MVGKVQGWWSEPLQSSHLFHMAPYSASLLLALGADFTAVSQLIKGQIPLGPVSRNFLATSLTSSLLPRRLVGDVANFFITSWRHPLVTSP